MAGKFSSKGLIKGLPFCVLAVLALLLLVLLAGTPFDGKISSTEPETAKDEVRVESRNTRVASSSAVMQLPVSQGTELRKKDPDKKNKHTILITRENSLRSKDSRAYQADAAWDRYAAAEDSRFLDEERLADSEGAMYTEEQLKDLDPETIRLIEEEFWLALEEQPEVELEFDLEEIENALADEALILEEERLLYSEGAMYTEAQLADLDPETISLVEEEIRQASEQDN
ncbi:MAG: hypothetical protein AB1461_13550 [Thermodesulfobacteriota bacterium]